MAPGGGEQPADAPGREDRASIICGDHGGVRTIGATRVVCFDGARTAGTARPRRHQPPERALGSLPLSTTAPGLRASSVVSRDTTTRAYVA